MNYLLDIFSPETWQKFKEAGSTVTGIRDRYRRLARERVNPGDLLLCYLTGLSRWCGVLEVESGPYTDETPIWANPDPYIVRFNVSPIVVLDIEASVPIKHERIWQNLTITKNLDPGGPYWSGFFRNPFNTIDGADGKFLMDLLKEQKLNPVAYPFSDSDRRKLASNKIRTLEREVEVEVPDNQNEDAQYEMGTDANDSVSDVRESIRRQADVARIGVEMGFHIWVPRGDKSRVLGLLPETMHGKFLDELPLNYDNNTLYTVEHIDVIWLKGRSMARAFEIEHTTSIYSGLLRMADLLALQPNMNIKLHIVASLDKRERVLREIRRPVFSLLDRGPLYETCSFLSYDSIQSLVQTPYLAHMSDTIIEEYEEIAEV